jgi:mono/diheme cytochrome c family protein
MSPRGSGGVRLFDLVAWTGAVLFLLHGLGREADAAQSPATVFATECGGCHVAYPGQLMQPADWSRVLGSLDHHYGVDASLDPQALAAVASHLGAQVSPAPRGPVATPLPRITTSGWFRKEHGEVPSRAWSSPSVRSAANCSACHTGAGRGNFDEHSVRIPGEVNRESED